jgi:hypothetical protein
MEEVRIVAGVMFLCLILAFAFRGRKKRNPRERAPVQTSEQQPLPRSAADRGFDEFVAKTYGNRLMHSFHTTIAGVTHPNPDGTDRVAYILKCREREPLTISHDALNGFSKHACIVAREEGGAQLGYLHDDAGATAVSRMGHGTEVMAVFCHQNHHPETNRIVGGTILLMFLGPET